MALSRNDTLIQALRNARPEVDHDPSSADAKTHTLVQEIISSDLPAGRALRRGIALRIALPTAAVVAVAVTLALVAQNTAPTVDIGLVAAKSRSAFSTSGRAKVEFATDIGLAQEQKGLIQLTFVRENVQSATEFGPSQGSPGFKTQNRTVSGDFYLLDGEPGQQRWVHVTNEPGLDLFSLDPRKLLELLAPSANFETVGDTNGVRHLRAASLDGLPDINLGLGPIEDFTKLELWVGPDDVVQRFDLATESTETHRSGGRTILVPRADGQMHKTVDPNTGELVTSTHRSTYSVSFSDLGAQDIVIVAPDGAVRIEGKG